MASWAADASRLGHRKVASVHKNSKTDDRETQKWRSYQAVLALASEVLASVEACVEAALKGSRVGVRGG